MILDIIFIVILLLALLKGYSQGLIMGLFSLLSVIIGLAAALKFSAVVASYIGDNINVSKEWLPLISFIIVFVIVVLLIRLAAKAVQRTFEMVMLGWVNRLGGMIFFAAIYTLVFSVLLFYAEQMKVISPETISNSKTWPYIRPLGPQVIDGLGSVLPFFKNMFVELQEFFGRVSNS